MNLEQSLDRYLTSGPPDDGFEDYCERVLEVVPEEVYAANQEWFDKPDGECNELLNRYHIEDVSIGYAAYLLINALPEAE